MGKVSRRQFLKGATQSVVLGIVGGNLPESPSPEPPKVEIDSRQQRAEGEVWVEYEYIDSPYSCHYHQEVKYVISGGRKLTVARRPAGSDEWSYYAGREKYG